MQKANVIKALVSAGAVVNEAGDRAETPEGVVIGWHNFPGSQVLNIRIEAAGYLDGFSQTIQGALRIVRQRRDGLKARRAVIRDVMGV